ncbi:hypothetical protein T310_0576 [Rasamsonia emersonii CBS 393.64]|uniref:Uncharacterized protein n=1 Tax=Rasamsonia emersonii (strain ATCC 16479 / CBS 393.64 / IMI 116815) TaxID=1408163 RepID=A0A0F4Z6A2_RASE3|nr:hypothetical protein T310_0576 [Rasamsonia emersonii CBS 393.64]KKA25398.1 hypothetical protein T310_0576 [Rasamsonia emersonii CBS 393.64]
MSHEWARLWRATEDEESGTRKWRVRNDLRLKPINVEKGAKRFPVYVMTYLVSNSQDYANEDRHQIYVWKPSGPWQVLGSTPEMIITPVMKDPNAEGYISPEFPHAINNILVDDLGRDEVLLLATDSGNVCGYHVESIFSALERAKANNEKRPVRDPHIDPFLCEHVGMSAWGLAIHKLARLIAVSANTGLITVFAFALVDTSSESSDDSESPLDFQDDYRDYGQNWLNVENNAQFLQFRRLMPDRYRSRNVRLTYTGHFTNIPCVSFLNCDLDPNGTWMVSTDIDNKLLVWKIWEGLGPFNAFHFSDASVEPFPQTLRNDERGWSVLALDPRTFRLKKSLVQACGGCPYQKMRDSETVFDLTHLSREVQDASHLYNYFPPAVRSEPEEPTIPDIFDPDCCISKDSYPQTPSLSRSSDTSSDDELSDIEGVSASNVGREESHEGRSSGEQGTDGQRSAAAEAETRSDQPTPHQAADNNNNGHFTLDESMTANDVLQLILQEALGDAMSDSDIELEVIDDENAETVEGGGEQQQTEDSGASEDASDHSAETGEASSQHSSGVMRDTTSDPNTETEEQIRAKDLPSAPEPICFNFPILHFSQTDIRLIPHPFASYPSVVCGGPLRQPFTRTILSIRSYDRFNMVKYVPEHGIVIAATQKGRAAVITLTEAPGKGLTFRINWMLPLASQEKYADRPLIPLLGIAVSPVQGFEKPADVSYIPRGACDRNDLSFHYKFQGINGEPVSIDNSDGDSWYIKPDAEEQQQPTEDEMMMMETESDLPTNLNLNRPHSSKLTLPECHAIANRNYQPHERWQGWNPSRRYRLFLTYGDHTVMSYEFWYEWSDTVVGENYDGERDDLLLI